MVYKRSNGGAKKRVLLKLKEEDTSYGGWKMIIEGWCEYIGQGGAV